MHFCENGILVQSVRLLLNFFFTLLLSDHSTEGYKGNFETLRFFLYNDQQIRKGLVSKPGSLRQK